MAFDLNGIWATDPDLCGKMFEKHGNEVAFTPLSDLYGSGLVDGDTDVCGEPFETFGCGSQTIALS